MRGHPAFSVLAARGLGAVLWLPLVNVAPNRLVSGQGVLLWNVWQDMAVPTVAWGFFVPFQCVVGAVLLLIFAAGLWVLTLVLWLAVMDALHRLQAGLVARSGVSDGAAPCGQRERGGCGWWACGRAVCR